MDANQSAGGIGRSAPLGTGPHEPPVTAPEAEAQASTQAATRSGLPSGRWRVLASIANPGAPVEDAVAPAPALQAAAPAPAAEAAPASAPAQGPGAPASSVAQGRAGPPSGRMLVFGSLVPQTQAATYGGAMIQQKPALRAGAFESAGHRMWQALGDPDAVVDPEVAKRNLPPQVVALLERLRAAGGRPTVAELQAKWLAESQSVELRGPQLERFFLFARRAGAAEVGGLLGTHANATIEPKVARSRLSGDLLELYERLRARGGRVTVGDLARARAAQIEAEIRRAAGTGGLSKREAARLPESIQTVLRTYYLEGRGPVAHRRPRPHEQRADRLPVAPAPAAPATQTAALPGDANADGVISKAERRRLEVAEREGELARFLAEEGEGLSADRLADFLTGTVDETIRRALGDDDAAAIDDERARRALPSELYARLRTLAAESNGPPPTVGAFREALAADVEREARAALEDGSLSGREKARLARFLDPESVAAVRAREQEERTEDTSWIEELEDRFRSTIWDFFTMFVLELRLHFDREEDERREREDARRRDDHRRQLAKDDLRREIEAETQAKEDVAAEDRAKADAARDEAARRERERRA